REDDVRRAATVGGHVAGTQERLQVGVGFLRFVAGVEGELVGELGGLGRNLRRGRHVIAQLVVDPQTQKLHARSGVCGLAQRERHRAVCALLRRDRPASLALPVADGPLLDRPFVDHAGADGTLAEHDGPIAALAGAIVLPLSKLRPFDHLRVDCVTDQRSDHEAQLRLPPDRTDRRAHPWEYLPRHYTGLRNTCVTRERYRSSSRRSITRPSFPFDSMKLNPPVARSETMP